MLTFLIQRLSSIRQRHVFARGSQLFLNCCRCFLNMMTKKTKWCIKYSGVWLRAEIFDNVQISQSMNLGHLRLPSLRVAAKHCRPCLLRCIMRLNTAKSVLFMLFLT